MEQAKLQENQKSQPNLQQKFQAVFVLACVGDALGYRNGSWEFQKSGQIIHKEYQELTQNQGMKNLTLNLSWRYSDDTVMHIATGQALSTIKFQKQEIQFEQLMQQMAIQYKLCWGKMSGRAPGKTTGKAIKVINQDGKNWNKIPFNQHGGGCGGSMRSACIGLLFKYPEQLDNLIAVSVESARLTHHHPTGYLGSVVSALFTSLAISDISINKWGSIFLTIVYPKVIEYIKQSNREVDLNLKNFDYFINAFQKYLTLRQLSLDPEVDQKPVFPENYDQILEREHFYKEISFRGWGGASGHDSVIIAYDALLGSNLEWEQVCQRGVLHGGDNDTTGTIVCAWYGALKGYEGVYEKNYKNIEDYQVLQNLGNKLYQIYLNLQKNDKNN